MNTIQTQSEFFLYQADWQTISLIKNPILQRLLEQQLTTLQLKGLISLDSLAEIPVSFYPGAKLLRIEYGKDLLVDSLYFLYHPEHQQIDPLNGTSTPIHKWNGKGRIQLDENNLFDYLRFFCFFVQGELGAFLIVESLANPLLKTLDSSFESQMESHLKPLERIESNDDNIVIKATVFYGFHLFSSEFAIDDSGTVSMLSDNPLCEFSVDCGVELFHIRTRLENWLDAMRQDQLVEFIDIKELKVREKRSEETAKQIYQSYLEKLEPSSGYLPFARVPNAYQEGFDRLRQNHPHFGEVIDYIEQQFLLLTLLDNAIIKIQPILIDGSPGIGKTRFGYDLAQVLQVAFEIINCGNVSAGFEIGGASTVWKSGRPGRVVDTILRAGTINPLIMLDEIDKMDAAGYSHNVMEALYSLLEPITAKSFKDEGLSMATNCSHINWIATCNEYNRLPPAIQSRFRRFQIAAPNRTQMVSVIRSIFKDLLSEHRWGQKFENQLSDETACLIAEKQVPPRLLKGILLDACGKAVLRYQNSNRLHKEKIVLRSEDISVGKRIQESRRIGFVQ